MRSLRVRLTLAIVGITLVASAVVGVGLGRYTRSEFQQFLDVESEVPVSVPDTVELEGHLRSGDLVAVRAAISAMREQGDGSRFLLFAPNRALLVDTDPGDEATLDESGRLQIVSTREVNGNRTEEQVAVQGGVRLGTPDESLGTLFVVPRIEHEARVPPAVGFTRTISRAHLVGILIATGLALIIALVLSGRILGPIETLTRAARRLAQGDLGQRVNARSSDEIGELSRAFNAMAASLEQQETVRRNMVSDIAHELRTPLTHLRCKLESVEDGLVTADDELLRGLHQEIVHLGRLVDDLQELALAEAGRLPLHPKSADLEPITHQVVSTLPAGEGGPSVTVEVSRGLPAAHVDVDRYRQVLRNLLQNALRHGAVGGHVIVRLLATSREDGERTVRCEVRDDGPGIPAEHLERVFDRFHRTDPSRGRATGGAGLGLAIARQLVIAWDGAIGVESEPGHGATFWFTVPSAEV